MAAKNVYNPLNGTVNFPVSMLYASPSFSKLLEKIIMSSTEGFTSASQYDEKAYVGMSAGSEK